MDFAELGSVVDALSKERGIERSVVIGAIEKAFLVATRKKFGIQGEYETKYSEATDEIETFQYKNVVESVRDDILEITLAASHELDPEAEIGDQIGIKLDKPNFTRVDIQTIRQIIFQKVRDAEREILFSEFKHREGELITGIARRYERGNVIVDLGKADAVLPRRETIYGENFKVGDRIQAYLTEVVMVNRGPEIRLSRTTPLFLVKLFEIEVPEIADGTIEIKSAAREPGQRAKIAVYTRDRDIDPVGACVGLKGSRVQNIVAELQGEKIDIVRWADDIETFSRAALAPSEIENIMIDYDEKSMDVVVEDDQLSLAIGRRGQNVRLAAMLSGYRINIISKTKLQERINRAAENLAQVEGMTETRAQVLVQHSVMAIGDLSVMEAEELAKILNIGSNDAQEILDNTHKAIESGNITLQPDEEDELVSASAVPPYCGILSSADGAETSEVDESDKFSDAERRLREELAAFKLK